MSTNLPSDFTLLKTRRGYLIVSPSHGVYCAVHEDEHDEVCAWIKNSSLPLTEALEKRFKEHGIFDGPRPFRRKHHLIQFQVTNACNLRCVYCSAESGCARSNELTLNDIKRCIDEALEINPDYEVSFTGGEPLIVPWILDAIDYAMSKTHTGLLSNLLITLKNETLFEAIADRINQGLQVQMSMSGTDRDVCDKLSGRACYDDGIAVLRKFEAKGIKLNLDLIMSAPDAQANIDAFAEFRRSIPENTDISIGLIYPCGREKGEHIFTSRDDIESFFDDVTFEGGVSVPGQKAEPMTNRRKACSCIENESIFVRSDGAVYSCFKMVECFGHIKDGLKSVMNKRRKEAVMAAQLPICHNCPFVSLCAAGCRADNIILTGNTKAPICGPWRKELIAEMLYDDASSIFDWSIQQQLTEAKKLGFKTPSFVITSLRQSSV